MHKTYLALGSNLGDRRSNLTQAIHEIAKKIGEVKKASKFYRTDPLNPSTISSQPEYLNAVVECWTTLSASDLLHSIREIESLIGLDRRTKEHWGPRIIDIDILTFDEEKINSTDLTIPHKEMENRDFVLVPLQEIEPDFKHPSSGKHIKQMLADLKGRGDSTYVIAPI